MQRDEQQLIMKSQDVLKVTHVWYASYGSNMNPQRFYCYIQGGRPEGSTKTERGCRDKELPTSIKTLKLPYEAYFAHYSDRWGGAPVFIDPDRGEKQSNFVCYLITMEQYLDVMAQENGLLEVESEMSRLVNDQTATLNGLYGKMMNVGTVEGFPVFTFTNPKRPVVETEFPPSIPYLQTIMKGLKGQCDLNAKEIAEYLLHLEGVSPAYSYDELVQIVNRLSQ
ncbi:hypothetical protein RYX56_16605 [Alkalihalophilus lindianensis]|uniref:Histone deacetylase n=1 Tax=Alkalihalophilus lindianensis TaxID=1630542 RepID=A0ABU3XDM6_9BACI|nr:hypothetical protein [Alkalihalophilus lindianensis]MDV2685990.1 hypothetical protein [Alkalihalophilus lindianensis]